MSRVLLFRSTLFAVLVTIVSATDSVTRSTLNGNVTGMKTDKAQIFKGIPFANPPGRWEEPQPVDSWTGTLDATQTRGMCYQPDSACIYPEGTVCLKQKSEDCLFVNVYAPLGTRPCDSKEVLVYIHGGFFQGFTPNGESYNMDELVKAGDIIAVTMSYRLGAFGFFIFDLSESGGNYGLMDQILAMKWVKDNIKFFGGDPKKITLGGDSVGATSVLLHMSSPEIKQLFHQAVLISPPIGIPLKDKSEAVAQGQMLENLLGCSDMDCLKSKSADEINTAMDSITTQTFISQPDNFFKAYMPWGPYVTENVLEAKYRKIPTFIGTTINETAGLVYRFNQAPMTYVGYEYVVKRWKPNVVDDIADLYDLTDDGSDLKPKLINFNDDVIFDCPVRQIADELADNYWNRVYKYVFQKYGDPNDDGQPSCSSNAACHGQDLIYWFGKLKFDQTKTDYDRQISEIMMRYLTNFVKFGKPNSRKMNEVRWPKYISRGRLRKRHLVLALGNGTVSVIKDYNREECKLWDKWGILDSMNTS